MLQALKHMTKREYLISLVVAILFMIESFFTEKVFLLPSANNDPLLIYSKIILFVVVFFLSLCVCRRIRAYRFGIPKEDKVFAAFFLVFAAWFTLWLIGLWPGILSADSYVTLNQVRTLYVDNWLSYVTTLLYLLLYYIFPAPVSIAIFQIILTAGTFAWILLIAYKWNVRVWVILIFAAALVLSVPIIINTLFYTRDTVFGVVHLWLAVYVFNAILEKKFNQRYVLNMGVLITVIVFLAVIRADGIPLLIIVPVILFVWKVFDRKQLFKFALISIVAFSFFSFLFPKMVKVVSNPMGTPLAYQMSVMTNPLSYMLQHNFYSPTKEKDIETLNKVVDVQKLITRSHPYDIPAFWEGAWNFQSSNKDFQDVNRVYMRMVKDNMDLFLTNRVITFLAGTSLNNNGFLFGDGAREGLDNLWPAVADIPKTSLFFDNFAPGLLKQQIDFLNSTKEYHGAGFTGRFLHWNFMPHLLIIMVVMLLYPYVPIAAATSVIIFYRLPVVFLTSPASTFKYYYSLYLFGIVVILLALVERKLRRRAGD